MNVQYVGHRGIVFRFSDPYEMYSYVIADRRITLICDTSVGPEPMAALLEHLRESGATLSRIHVFNSHADYDHYWGNCLFTDATIIGHTECRERIMNEGQRSLTQYSAHMRGRVLISPPNRVFSNELRLTADIRLFHSPGHTSDSCSCVDESDRVLFVGDNVEYPIPYVNSLDIGTYIATLRGYATMDWDYMVTGHSSVHTDTSLLDRNIAYLEELRDWRLGPVTRSPECIGRHATNVVTLVRQSDNILKQDELLEHCTRLRDILMETPDLESQETLAILDGVISGDRRSQGTAG